MTATTKAKSPKVIAIEEVAAALGLTMTTDFVPWSQSCNSGGKYPSLNWRVTLHHNSRVILTTDYSAGCAHCPSYNKIPGIKTSIWADELLRGECNTGHAVVWMGKEPMHGKGETIKPEFADVLHSLVCDSDALDHPTYESWASDLGYDPDSRKGEATYRACLEIALKLRAAIGEVGLSQLREVCQDY